METLNITFSNVSIAIKESSFDVAFEFKGIEVCAMGTYSYDGSFPNIVDIEFIDCNNEPAHIGIVDQKFLSALIEVELNEKYSQEMYSEWSNYNGADEHGDY